MAVPSSGELSLRGIRDEIGTNNYNGSTSYTNISLNDLSIGTYDTINICNPAANRPDGTEPHEMSEFYSYDHDIGVTVSSFSCTNTTPSGTQVCGQDANSTLYHDGAGGTPTTGDSIYTTSCGTTTVGAGYFGLNTSSGVQTDSSGEVISTYTCARSERRLKYNIEFIGDSPMGIPMYHFNYKDESYGKGRFIGTMVDDLERLGFEDSVFEQNGEIWVNYDKIDVPFMKLKD
jgi:hypothetical protein